MNKILVTGCVGFIGFHLTKYLLEKNYNVVGIDNINNYYSIKIKKNRKKELNKYKNFNFQKIDISNFNLLQKLFVKNKFKMVFNLAAQAGVSYSVKYPEKYFNTNIKGFFNICKLSKDYSISKVIYASSSSVYGDNKNLPVKEIYNVNPLNYYAISKVNNEVTAKFFSEVSNIKFIGLRFFSVYGPFGRPDMLIYKMINAYNKKKIFYLNNFGNHSRDFTYIDDVVQIIFKLSKLNLKNKSEIFNICNSKKIKLSVLIDFFKKKKILPKIIKRKFQFGDIKHAYGDNKKLRKIVKLSKYTKFEEGLDKTFKWYFKNNL